jgi:putative oxidoreductase
MLLTLKDAASAPSGGLLAALLIGRVLFATIFILSGIAHLTKLPAMTQYAAAFKVPQPKLAVVVSGLMILAGGVSILLGAWVRVGALLLVLFLVPVAMYIHPFWGVPDPMQAANQQAHFLKNLSLAGAALLIYYFATLYPEAWVYSVGR